MPLTWMSLAFLAWRGVAFPSLSRARENVKSIISTEALDPYWEVAHTRLKRCSPGDHSPDWARASSRCGSMLRVAVED